ncbi:MAG TPA: ABC transporter permease [Parafilimonas sp.]|nr:ABC transporter permease [Parafilimonas sp.]
MFKTYLKTALRNLKNHKSNSFINIAGLMVGFAAFLLIFLVIQYENSFEDFNTNKNELYRVVRIGRSERENEYRTGVPFPVTQTLRTDLPQLKNATAIFSDNNVQVNITAADGSVLKKFKEKYVFSVEPQFFKMFNFPLVAGNINTALNDVNTVLLSKDVALKYFGDWHAAMNKTISLYGLSMKVTGILENPPTNTDFPLSVVVSYATLMKFTDPNDWESISDRNYCLVQLNKNASVSHFNQLLDQFTTRHIKPVNPNYDLSLQPLKEVHYDERYGNFTGRTFSKDLIFALSLIGIFLLVIACVNFINITTAQAIDRAREVGVRKVLGSSRKQLIWQFLGETGITTFCALTGAVIMGIFCLPAVNSLLDIHLATTDLFNAQFILFIILSLVVVTFLSGFYPALILSGFKSINVLKSTFTVNNKGISLRRALVVFQFVIAQALIIGTLIVASQMNYFHNADMGFNKNAIINANIPGDSLSQTKADVLYNELSKLNGVQRVSFSAFAPAAGGGWYTDLINGNDQKESPHMIVSMKPADTGYFDLYNLKLVAGRVYFPSDTMREFVVNETITKNLGYQDPHSAIGKMINVNGKRLPIVGVVKNFHAYSLRDSIGPVILTTIRNAYGLANIKIDMNKAKPTIASIQNIYSKLFPDFIFEYNFLDQTIADYYKQENELSVLYKIFSGIAIFISCLGLYGLISFMAIQRRKEIGIRKVLGAPVRDIVIMLSKEFTILIAIAFLIASPIAWYFMHQWLQQYTYRIAMGVWFFVATILCALIIAWITVGYTAIKAAIANPVVALRSE